MLLDDLDLLDTEIVGFEPSPMPTLTHSQQEIARSAVRKLALAILAGSVLGAVGLGWAWKAHRILGALLGWFIVGPAVGTAAGCALAWDDVKQLDAAAPKRLAAPSGTRWGHAAG